MIENPFLHHLKLLVKHSKYIIPILTIMSVVKQVFFYSFFQIKIGYYISLTEILSMFLNDTVFYCLCYAFVFILSAFVPTNFLAYNNEQMAIQSKRNLFKRFFFHKNSFTSLIVPLIAATILLFMGQHWEFILAAFLASPITYIIMFARDELIRKFKINFSPENVSILNNFSMLTGVFLLMLSLTLLDVSSIKYNNYREAIVILDNRTVECKGSIVLLGTTQNYTFLYNNKLKESIIIPNSAIKETRIIK